MTVEGKPASGSQRPASGESRAFDTSIAHQARIYDYLLGGKDNFAADRQAGEAMIAAYPEVHKRKFGLSQIFSRRYFFTCAM